MPEIRMNSLKSRAMNCGPLSEMIRGFASGYFSLAQRTESFWSDRRQLFSWDYFRVARRNEAARAADAAACIDPSVATALLKNEWGRRVGGTQMVARTATR